MLHLARSFSLSFAFAALFAGTAGAASVTYLQTDTTTLGNWKGVYGQDGNVIAQPLMVSNFQMPDNSVHKWPRCWFRFWRTRWQSRTRSLPCASTHLSTQLPMGQYPSIDWSKRSPAI